MQCTSVSLSLGRLGVQKVRAWMFSGLQSSNLSVAFLAMKSHLQVASVPPACSGVGCTRNAQEPQQTDPYTLLTAIQKNSKAQIFPTVTPKAFLSIMHTVVTFLPGISVCKFRTLHLSRLLPSLHSPSAYVTLTGGTRAGLAQGSASCETWRHAVYFGCYFLWMFSYRKQELPGIPLSSYYITALVLYTGTYFSV